MAMGPDLRQGADQSSLGVIAVVVMDVDEEIRAGRALGRNGRAGQPGHLIGFRSCREMENTGNPHGHQNCKTEQHWKLPSAPFRAAQHSIELSFTPIAHQYAPFLSFLRV